MKRNLNIYIALTCFLTMLSGCEEFLEVEPESTLGINSFYTTPTEADIALAGIYGVLADDDLYGQGMNIIMEAGTDEGFYNRRYNEGWQVSLYRHTALTDRLQKAWGQLYQAINLSNLFLENIKEGNFTQEEFTQYKAEARFLRAHSFHLLTNWWNEIPLQLTSTKNQSDNHLAASSLEDVYTQIISDYTYASENLPGDVGTQRTNGRANKWAAHGLLARLYLKMAGQPYNDETKYELAKQHCKIVMDSQIYRLNPTATTTVVDANGDTKIIVTEDGYRNHFLSYLKDTYDHQESIFEISFKYLRALGLFTDGRVGTTNGIPFPFGGGNEGFPFAFGGFSPGPVLETLYEQNNDSIRKWWNVPRYKYSGDGNAAYVRTKLENNYTPGKFRRWEPTILSDWYNPDNLNVDPEPAEGAFESYTILEEGVLTKNFTSINFPVLRYADILLMYAEAENKINGPTSLAINAMDKVRQRAGLDLLLNAKPYISGRQDLFFNEIVDERMRELCFEGLRKTDLIRWGLLEKKLDVLEQAIRFDDDFSENNANHQAYLRSSTNFKSNPEKFKSLPYPFQEVTINNKLDQKPGW
jgi:hypothetical protein